MRILALETSAKAVSAAIAEDGKILAYGYQDAGLTHSRTLMPIVEDLTRESDFDIKNLDLIAVAAGPGSFTGIRIGIAAAKGLGFGLDKPVLGVSTLAAMARNICFADGLILCAMDARRARIYHALFHAQDGNLTRLTEDTAIDFESLVKELRELKKLKAGQERNQDLNLDLDLKDLKIMLVGDGAKICADYLSSQGILCKIAPANLIMQNAASVALEAEKQARDILSTSGRLPTARELRPVYLRPPNAVPPPTVKI